MDRQIRVAVIGATGSVGSSVLDICRRYPSRIKVAAVAAGSDAKGLLRIAMELEARYAVLKAPTSAQISEFRAEGIELLAGTDGLSQVVASDSIDHAVFASSGTDAIIPLLLALKADKDVSLANKESIVAAGHWVMPAVTRADQLRPVDSEHSAVWQCLREDPHAEIQKIYLTASGGPFLKWSADEMADIRPSDALKHPTWNMGAKITIDSATLMNKGIECIEAMQLFSLSQGQVDAVIHPSSLVHGMVVFCDSTVKMLMTVPDMRFPAAAALAWPDRLPIGSDLPEEFPLPDFDGLDLRFERPDTERFPCLKLATDAFKSGRAYPSILIGADQFAVEAFLRSDIRFTDIASLVERSLELFSGPEPDSIEDAIELIDEGYRLADRALKTKRGMMSSC